MPGIRKLPYAGVTRQSGGRLMEKQGSAGAHLLRSALMAVSLLIGSAGFGSAEASMFVCRDKWGGVSFTNVPNSSDCSAYTFKEGKRKTDSNYFSSRESKRKSSRPAVRSACDPSKFDHDIRRVARRYKVDPSLIKAIIHTESSFDHRAVSSQGAQGLMQLMPATARELRVSNPFNPRENIDGGTRYFCQLMDSFNGDLILSLAAYNAGPGLVMRTGGVPRIPETLRYVNKVLKRYKQYRRAW